MGRGRTAVGGLFGVVVLAPVVLSTASCGAPGPDPEPVVGTVAAPASTTTATTTIASTTAEAPPTDGEGAGQVPDQMGAVDAVLAAYGRLLTELSADPGGRPAPGGDALARWDVVVLPGSALSEAMLERLQTRAVVERTVVEPNGDGVSFRHRATALVGTSPDTIDFEWCGWSPGVARSLDSGEVTDDAVGHATGTGRVERHDGRWQLAALDQTELELLAPGSGDPCTDATPEFRG